MECQEHMWDFTAVTFLIFHDVVDDYEKAYVCGILVCF